MSSMNGKNYWLIPLVFTIIFSGIGFILWSYVGIFTLSVNGSTYYLLPSNYLTWYNTANGPFSSIFLANFIWDGWGNFQVLIVYTMVFGIVDINNPQRSSRAGFLVLGSLLSAFVATAVGRIVLSANTIAYGQSAVAAGFAGIVIFYVMLNMSDRESRQRIFSNTIEGVGSIFAITIGVSFLSLFFVEPEPIATVYVHMTALVTGI